MNEKRKLATIFLINLFSSVQVWRRLFNLAWNISNSLSILVLFKIAERSEASRLKNNFIYFKQNFIKYFLIFLYIFMKSKHNFRLMGRFHCWQQAGKSFFIQYERSEFVSSRNDNLLISRYLRVFRLFKGSLVAIAATVGIIIVSLIVFQVLFLLNF